MKKKTFTIMLASMTLALTACGGTSESTENNGISTNDPATAAEQTDTQLGNDTETEDENDASDTSSYAAREIVSYGGNSVNGRLQGSGSVCMGDGVIYYVTSKDDKGNSSFCCVNLDGSGYSELLSFSDFTSMSQLNYYNGAIYYCLKEDGSTVRELHCLDEDGDRLIEEFEGSLKIQNFNDDLFFINRDETEIRIGVFNLSSEEQNLFYTGTANGSMTDIIDTDGTYIYIYLYDGKSYGMQPYRISWDSVYDEGAAMEEISVDSLGTLLIYGSNGFYTVNTEDNGTGSTNFVYYDYANIVSGDSGTEWNSTIVLEDVENDWADNEKRIETLFWNANYAFILNEHFISIDSEYQELYCSDSLDYRLSTCINDDFYSGMESYSDLSIFEYDGMIYYFDMSNGSEGMTIHHIDSNGNIDS
ncbi:MAG: hypothetical protein LUD01_10865 [Clostridiales bacterium]|nr:hypothetical protein [Clostridiales bacterium]